MRLDHIAFRVKDRHKTAKFFIEAFGYKIQQEFQLEFADSAPCSCLALEPSEKVSPGFPWSFLSIQHMGAQEYHMPCEIFISDGPVGSIVGDWVKSRGGVGGVHHFAFQVDDVEAKMKEWKENGYAEFTTDKPLGCPEDDLVQVFTKPSELTGVIIELIKRGEHGFCRKNVAALMQSTRGM